MKNLPELWRTVIALLDGGGIGPVAVVGYVALEKGGRYCFCVHGGNVYHTALLLDWRYLSDVLPEYCPPQNDKFLEGEEK